MSANFFFLGHDDVKVRFTWPQLQHVPYAMDCCDAFMEADCPDEEFLLYVPLIDARRLIHLRNLLEAVIHTEVDLIEMHRVHFSIPGLNANCPLPFISYTAPWLAAIPSWPRTFLAALGAYGGEDLLDLFSTTTYLCMWNLRKAVGYRILWLLAAANRDGSRLFEDADTWTLEDFRKGIAALPFGCQTMLLHLYRENYSDPF